MAMIIAEIHLSYADITMKTMQVSVSANIEIAKMCIEMLLQLCDYLDRRRQASVALNVEPAASPIEIFPTPYGRFNAKFVSTNDVN
jgi:hypothetical protein